MPVCILALEYEYGIWVLEQKGFGRSLQEVPCVRSDAMADTHCEVLDVLGYPLVRFPAAGSGKRGMRRNITNG
jgi:hypothetical protein